MTENRIFEIILENNGNTDYNYDFPKLQAESANAAAEKFTEIIYETLKQKSTASHLKRGNILKYLRQMCRVKNCHLNEDSYECFLKILRNSLQSNETGDILQLVCEINSELEREVPQDLAEKMVDFYRRKNSKHKDKLKKLEFMNKMSQEKLDLKFNIQVRRNFSYNETSENVIRGLVGQTNPTEKKSSVSQSHSAEYRQKQIKFGYALLNLKNSDLCLVEAILQRLSTYKKLEEFEVNFLLYLFLVEDEVLNFSCIISDKFPLIFERLILKYTTEILSLKEDAEVHQYFTDLEKDKKLAKIRRACTENTVLGKTMISLIYVYCHSACNENVLKLIEFIK